MDKEQIRLVEKEMKSLEKLPSEFYELYRLIHHQKNTNGVLFDGIRGSHKSSCPCLEIAFRIQGLNSEKKTLFANTYVYSWHLEERLTQGQCLDYLASNYDFLYGQKGIRKAAPYYFNKEIHELDRKELATLVLMMRNASLYNPKKRPGLIDEELAAFDIL